MAIMPYLAMTAAEIQHVRQLPERLGWMACHFSPYDTGLTNLPQGLPPGSLLILNDRIPIAGHDSDRIAQTLSAVLSQQRYSGLLLDFQRPNCQKTASLTAELTKLPFPVAVTPAYGARLSCPLFLPPVPPDQPLQTYLAPYSGKEIWLELALDGIEITVTADGSSRAPLPHPSGSFPHHCKELCCHYRTTLSSSKAVFTLRRTTEDISDLLQLAQSFGVTQAVGLWQELTDRKVSV